MTDVSPVKAHADPQPASLLYGDAPPPAFAHGSPALDGSIDEEESSTIKCICGFPEDDGSTVLCENCNTWQHILCYYGSTQLVPDIHECTDCQPRPVDTKKAIERQIQRRELLNLGERKGSKAKSTTKNHKKRVKDPLGSVQPNGWAVHSNNDLYYTHVRNGGNPQDQPPPLKRPKTNHRSSGSVSVLNEVPAPFPGSRKRTNSMLQNGYSPVKSPTYLYSPDDMFSPEFMNLYRQHDLQPTESNMFTDLGVANDMSLWLHDREALAEATGGLQPGQVFERIDQPIEELEKAAPVIVTRTEENSSITAHGLHPQWRYLTVETQVLEKGYVGELKGRIGRKKDYFQEPSNRWELLRHPEPFVFFPPHLPLYIDTRQDGTSLRYIRRSCDPNVQMRIFTQKPEAGVHFCLTATRAIEPQEELTIGWEIDAEIRQRLNDGIHNGDIRKEGLKKFEPWVACILANFGGCACDKSRGRVCLLERARRQSNVHAEPTPPAKSKGRKSKKPHVSPLSTGHATNSRAGSEAVNRNGLDDDAMDTRSTSGSHKSSSRDITPATHFSVDGGDLKLSDRERRKIQQQERLFEQLEYDEQHKGKKGKRNSAGSNLNTPSLSSSVRRLSRPSLFVANPDEQKQLGQPEPSPSSRTPREHNHGVARKPSGSRATNRSERRTKPLYVDTSTQTEDSNEAHLASPVAKARLLNRPRPIPFKHKLLRQALEDRMESERRSVSASVKAEARSPALGDVQTHKPSPSSPLVSTEESSAMDTSPDGGPVPVPAIVESAQTNQPSVDVEMKDADVPTRPRSFSPRLEQMPDAPPIEQAPATPVPVMQPPLPRPLTPAEAPADEPAPSTKPIGLQVQLPPPESIPSPASINSASTPGTLSGGAIAQSPAGLTPIAPPFSPAVASVVTPGPARKKLSLSDYTSRRAKLAQTQSSGASATPPLVPSHSISSPTLSTTSLPSQASPPGKIAEPATLPSVAEEPKTSS
jgi:hypothetical protein